MAIATEILPPFPPVPAVEADRQPSIPFRDNDDAIKRILFDMQKRLDEAEMRLTLGGL